MGALSIERFLFDPANASVGPNVGAYVRAADGTVITATGTALDVAVAGSMEVTATDLDIRDLVFASDKVDVSGSEVSLDAGTLAALENITVSATDLDIRDLVFATDKVDVSGSEVSLDATTLAALENITVSATDLDIRDLAFATDSVTAYQGGTWDVNLTDDGVADDAADSGNPFKIGGHAYSGALAAVTAGDRANLAQDLYRRVFIHDAPQRAMLQTAKTVTDVTGALLVSALAGRTRMFLQNLGVKPIYVGASGVADTDGMKVEKGDTLSLEIGDAVAIHAVAGTGDSVACRILEFA